MANERGSVSWRIVCRHMRTAVCALAQLHHPPPGHRELSEKREITAAANCISFVCARSFSIAHSHGREFARILRTMCLCASSLRSSMSARMLRASVFDVKIRAQRNLQDSERFVSPSSHSQARCHARVNRMRVASSKTLYMKSRADE